MARFFKVIAAVCLFASLCFALAACGEADIQSVSVTPPEKTEYFSGELLDTSGMQVTLTYKGGRTRALASEEYIIAPSPEIPLTSRNTTFTVAYTVGTQTYTDTFGVTVTDRNSGIAVEAETARFISDDAQTEIPSAATKTSGGCSLGFLEAGDELAFDFYSDGDGVVSLGLVVASKYLMQTLSPTSWTPVLVGEVLLTAMCDISVNGQDITSRLEGVVIPGGSNESGSLDLYFNWYRVEIPDISVKSGNNTVLLKFKKHNYTNVAEISDEDYAGNFGLNVDVLYVVPQQGFMRLQSCSMHTNAAAMPQYVNGDSLEVTSAGSLSFYNDFSCFAWGYAEDNEYSELINRAAASAAKRILSDAYISFTSSNGVTEYGCTAAVSGDGVAMLCDLTKLATGQYTLCYGSSGVLFTPRGEAFSREYRAGGRGYILEYTPGAGGVRLTVSE